MIKPSRYLFLVKRYRLMVRNSSRPCENYRRSDSLVSCDILESRMAHIPGFERSQLLLLPEAIDDYVGSDNPVRFIDAFVDRLDLGLWCKFLTWLKQDYVSVAFHAASTASHIVDAVLV
jgi:hypothetical protein